MGARHVVGDFAGFDDLAALSHQPQNQTGVEVNTTAPHMASLLILASHIAVSIALQFFAQELAPPVLPDPIVAVLTAWLEEASALNRLHELLQSTQPRILLALGLARLLDQDMLPCKTIMLESEESKV